jgi:hypothetical protein
MVYGSDIFFQVPSECADLNSLRADPGRPESAPLDFHLPSLLINIQHDPAIGLAKKLLSRLDADAVIPENECLPVPEAELAESFGDPQPE